MKRLMLMSLMALFMFSACGGVAEDRKSGNGPDPDGKADTSHVLVYRNVDGVPNIAYFCAGKYAWASSLTSTDGAGMLVRFPDYDDNCGGQR